MKRVFILLAFLLSLVCCKEERPGGNNPNQDEIQDEVQGDPVSDLFDYSKMGEHPRLLLRAGDFDRMKEGIASNSYLATVHEHIMTRADYLLSQEPLTYEKEGKRLLNVSRAALERILFMSYSYWMTGVSDITEHCNNSSHGYGNTEYRNNGAGDLVASFKSAHALNH